MNTKVRLYPNNTQPILVEIGYEKAYLFTKTEATELKNELQKALDKLQSHEAG